MLPENLLTTSGLSILMHGLISLPDATSYDKRTLFLSKWIYYFNSLSAITVNYSDRNIEHAYLLRCFKPESLQVEPSGAPGHKTK